MNQKELGGAFHRDFDRKAIAFHGLLFLSRPEKAQLYRRIWVFSEELGKVKLNRRTLALGGFRLQGWV